MSSRRVFRDSAIFYAVLAAAIVAFGLLTGRDAPRSIGIAAAFFVLATGYSWWRFRRREGEEEA